MNFELEAGPEIHARPEIPGRSLGIL